MNLNTKLYQDLRNKNALSIIRKGPDQCAFVIRQHDTYTGERQPDIVDHYSLAKLQAAIVEARAQLEGMESILIDTLATEVPAELIK